MRTRVWRVEALFAVCLALTSVGCVKIPQHNFQAPAPPVAPAPIVQSGAVVKADRISSAPIGPALIAAVPRNIDADRLPGGCANPCYHFALQTFDAKLADGRLVMSPTYRGNVQAKFNLAECDLDPVNVNVALSARLAVKKANNKWVLSLAGVNLQPSIGPGSDTRCVVGGLLDASGTLQDKLNEISGSMKSKVEALTFPIPIDDLESKLAGPIVLPSNGGRTVCVYPRITGLQIGGLQTSLAAFENAPFRIPEPPIRTSLPNLLEIPLAFLGAPSVLITNNSCPPAEPVPGNLDVSEASTEMPFRLLATIGADYPALSAAATSTLKPTQGQWGLLKLKFKPTRLQVANANGQVLAALSLTGSISGTVYFWGTPATSIDGKTVFLSNLNLAAESRAALSSKDARLPDFIANLFKAPIQEAFSLNLAKVFPQSDGSQPISFPLPNNGILRLGALKLRIDTVKSVEGQLDATIVIEGDPGAWNP